MKKPLTRKNSSSKSPNSTSTKAPIQNDKPENDKENQESSPASNHSDKENNHKHQTVQVETLTTPRVSSIPNAFTRLMSAKKVVISNDDLGKEESRPEETDAGINDSLIDFVEDVQSISKPTTPITISEIQCNGRPSFSMESSVPLSTEDSENCNNSSRRCSSRIQRNREIAEARRTEVFTACEETISIVRRNSKSKKRGRKSIPTPHQNRANKKCTDSLNTEMESDFDDFQQGDSLNDDKCIVSKKGQNAWKTASIFLMGKTERNKNDPAQTVEDPEKVAARKAFLLSSVPQLLRNQVDSNKEEESSLQNTTSHFSRIGHVQQINLNSPLWKLDQPYLPMRWQQQENSNYTEKYKEMTKNSRSAHWSLINSKSSSKTRVNKQQSITTEENKSVSLNVQQIYNRVKRMKFEEQINAMSSQQDSTSMSSIQRQNSTMKQQLAFPVSKIFRRYLERKLEADTLESEARRKNISLNEIEEERLSTTRKLRRRVRRQSGENKKYKKPTKRLKQESTNMDCHIENQKVTYDPILPSSMVWTMKYAPKMVDDVIGNSSVVKKLQKWLGEWEERDLERRKKHRRSMNGGSDSSDVDSNFSANSESSSDEEDKLPNTALLGKYSTLV